MTDADGIKKVRRLVVAQVVTFAVALVALGLTIANLNARTDAIQISRYDGRYSTCHLLRDLAYTAGGAEHRAAVSRFIDRTALHSCHAYAIQRGEP